MRSLFKRYMLVIILLLSLKVAFACTIVSVVDRNGEVWNMNNEDGPYGVANFLNVFPKSEKIKYGYYTLSYFSPELGTGGNIQGGSNEMGLTFDFNTIDFVDEFDVESRKVFPDGDDAILPYILSNMSTVEEVIDFFSTYWFQDGFRSAQMHVADRQGRFAIISASGVKLKEGQSLVSTNFDICGKESSASCWRYPVAVSRLEKEEINLLTMMSIALDTRQKNGSTMYTNIQNLSTGDIWLFSKHDPNVIVDINIEQLLAKGPQSYTFSDLKSIVEPRQLYNWKKPALVEVDPAILDSKAGKYNNSFTGDVLVKAHEQGFEITFVDGNTAVFHPVVENEYAILEADVKVRFFFDERADMKAMSLYENGNWTFTAWMSE